MSAGQDGSSSDSGVTGSAVRIGLACNPSGSDGLGAGGYDEVDAALDAL
ncbi:MAG TPA: hypothetical protein PL065_00925 [Polyangiaceae bacterium]|nr:hypothetical protein [Polyangiaceae bacterium]